MGTTENYKPRCLDEVDSRLIGFDIIKLLEGLPLGQALLVLDSTKTLLLDCHTVDLDNDQFMLRFKAHVESFC